MRKPYSLFSRKILLAPLFVSGILLVAFLLQSSASAVVPVISGITPQNTLTTSTTITWTTDVASDSQIEYGLTTAYGSSTTVNPALVTNHSQTVSGLQTNQLYHYRTKSRDASGDLGVSTDRTFITAFGSTTIGTQTDSSDSNSMNVTRFTTVYGGKLASLSVHVGAVDSQTANRSFQLALYTANGNVPGTLVANSGTGTLTANAWNTVPITATLTANTSYFIGYNTNGRTSTVNNMHYANGGTSGWRTGGQTFGTWPASFGAFSTQSATFSLYGSFVSDTTAPTVAIGSPADGATVTGNISVDATAADDTAVASVQFKLGGANLGAPDTTAPYAVSWDTTTLSNGPQTLTAVATDTSGNSTTSTPVSVTVNNLPRVTITQPTAGQNITSAAVTVIYTKTGDWITGGNYRVHLRLDGGATLIDLNSDQDQTFVISDVPGGSHTLEVIVADENDNELSGSGGSVSFTTAPPDITPPTVTITNPIDATSVNGIVDVTADAADDTAVASVQFKLGGANLGAPDTTAPYSIQWDTTTWLDGPQTLTAVASDVAGNTATAVQVTVSTNNPSKVTLTQPTPGQHINGISFTATYVRTGDWSNGQHVHFRLDGGGTIMDMNTDGNQSYTFNNLPSGSHTLEFVVASGSHVEQPGSGGSVSFTSTAPDITPPTVSVTAPTAGAVVQNTTTITADAADDVNVVGVQFFLDGNVLGGEDTTAPYSFSWNTTTVGNGSHTLTARARDTINQTTSTPVTVNVQNIDPRAVVGEWGSVMDWPLVSVHATMFHTGDILMWDAWDAPNTDAKLWNPISNVWTDVPLAIANSELFCAGQATGSTGELVVMGGHSTSGTLGTKTVFMFNPITKAWTRKADMGFARWYPSVTQMADNRMVTFSGQGASGVWSNTPEVFNPANNTVLQLPFSTPELAEVQYPQTSLLPSGKIMSISAEHGGIMLYDPANSSWNRVGTTQRPYGVWTSFAPGKYLITGGGINFGDYHDTADDPNAVASQKTTRILDMTSGSPVWTNSGDMHQGRSFHNVTMLPTGKALAVGGADILSDFARAQNATLTADMWDPATNNWTQMAAPAKPRMYHSVSILLPDGRVLSSGGGRLSPASDELNAQIYSPPYMFQGPRPTITSVPTNIEHNSTMDLVSPEAADITKVTFSTLASVTHTADWNQHFMELPFTRNGNTLTITTPANTSIAPDNYYMVFLVNSAGVPSIAKIVKLGSPDTTAPVITNIQATNVTGTGATINWLTDETSDTQVEYGTTTAYGSLTSVNTTLTTDHTQALTGLAPGTLYHYRVISRDSAGNTATSADGTFTTTIIDTQAPTVTLTAPLNGSTVSGSVTVTANASDNVGVAGVQFKLDGANLGSEDTTSPYSVNWSTTTSTNGTHTLTATARDASSNTTTATTVTVTVNNTVSGGLVGAWGFNEGSGTALPDLSGNGNNGSIFQAVWTTSGKYGSALTFDGSNDYVSVADANSLDFTNKLTLEAWVRPTSTSGWRTVLLKENSGELAYAMYSSENSNRPSGWIRVSGSNGSSQSVAGTPGLTTNTWTHMATTYDGTTLKLYINGSLRASKNQTGNLVNSSGPLKFGGNAVWGEYFAGQLDEIRLYNRVLSQTEIQTDMNTPL